MRTATAWTRLCDVEYRGACATWGLRYLDWGSKSVVDTGEGEAKSPRAVTPRPWLTRPSPTSISYRPLSARWAPPEYALKFAAGL